MSDRQPANLCELLAMANWLHEIGYVHREPWSDCDALIAQAVGLGMLQWTHTSQRFSNLSWQTIYSLTPRGRALRDSFP